MLSWLDFTTLRLVLTAPRPFQRFTTNYKLWLFFPLLVSTLKEAIMILHFFVKLKEDFVDFFLSSFLLDFRILLIMKYFLRIAWTKICNITYVLFLCQITIKGDKGPFKYYVIMFLTFLGPPTHLFDDVILEWSLIG